MKIVNIGGGLGNQMFQYAFYLTLKKIIYKNENVNIDTSFYDLNNIHNGYELKRIFNIQDKELKVYNSKNLVKRIVLKILREIGKKISYIYVEKREISSVKNIERFKFNKKILFFEGNWCSEEYFSSTKEELKRIFIFPVIEEEKNLQIKNKIETSESVSIHVRRGDYLENKIYGELVEKEYYEEAIKIIKNKVSNPIFFIFSNDIEWCKNNLKIYNNFYYIDWNKKENSYRDMQLMSLCKHNIIPHSTFSWWGAWLNNNPKKIVIAPKIWFNPKYSRIISTDIVPNTWIKIKNF